MNTKYKYIDRVFTIYVCLIPILEYYKSPLPSFNMATLVAMFFGIIFSIINFFSKQKKEYWNPSIYAIIYILFITFNVAVSSINYSYSFSWDNLSPWVRLVVLMYSLVIVGYRHFNLNYAISALKYIVCLSSIVILIQFLLYQFFGIQTKLTIPSLLTVPDYATLTGARFSAFYMEPAHFATSAIVFFVYGLFRNKIRILILILTAIGIIFSGSGQGYLYLALSLFFYLIYYVVFFRQPFGKKLVVLLFSFVVVGLVAVIIIRIPYVQYAISRVVSEGGEIGGVALSGRVSSGIYFESLSDRQKIFGVGFGHSKDITTLYLTSFNTHLIECGYLSIIPLAILVLFGVMQRRFVNFVLLIFIVIMIFFASAANPMTLSYLLLFLCKKDYLTKEQLFEKDRIVVGGRLYA